MNDNAKPEEPTTPTMVDLWTQLRGLENALRHYTDVLAGWMKDGGMDPNKPVSGVAPLYPIPLPPCDPPWCPYKRLTETAEDFKRVSLCVAQVSEALKLLSERLSVKEGTSSYVSELPGTHWPEHAHP